MRKSLLCTLFFLFFFPFSYSQITDSSIIGPGVTYYSEYRASGPWQFDVVIIDLTNPWLKLQTVKAGDRLKAFERTSSMAARNNYNGHRVVAAINGDFYNTSTGEPISIQVANGEILQNAANHLVFAWNEAKQNLMEVVNSSGIVLKGDSVCSINGYNSARGDNNLILYNSYFGSTTSTNAYGTEVLLLPLNGWRTNDTLLCVVENKSSTGNMNLVKGKAVLSGHGTAAAFVNYLETGDTIKVITKVTPGLPAINQVIGGHPVIVKDGVAQGTDPNRHPRTAIGINQDSTKLIWVTVDGRQAGYSIGMTFLELGQYMKEWGAYQALNLDGGGSTTMVIRGKVVNSPSDGTERTVSNGVLLISTAPDDSLDHVKISPKVSFCVGGSVVQYSVSGFDQYCNPVAINPVSVQWNCDASIGSVSSTGTFTALNDTVKGYVFVNVNGKTDSAIVYLTKAASIKLEPDPVILQKDQTQQMTPITKDTYGNLISLPASAFTWSVTGGVGSITTAGMFTAENNGIGTIEAEYDGVTGSVSVEVGTSTYVVIEDYTSTVGYSFAGSSNSNLPECSFTPDTTVFLSPPSSGKLHYSFAPSGTSTLFMDKVIPISGTPDKIGVSIYGDGRGHWLRGEFRDKDGERFLMDLTPATPGIDWINEWRYVEVPFTSITPSWANPAATMEFPVSWWRLYLAETSGEKKDSGSIYFDDFKVHFVSVPVGVNEDNSAPSKFELQQNYPNPFNPSTIINYSVPQGLNFVSLKVYDILGNEIALLLNEVKPAGKYQVSFNADNLPSGIYFYKLNTGSLNQTRKMVLLK